MNLCSLKGIIQPMRKGAELISSLHTKHKNRADAMSTSNIAKALKTWLGVHPLARQVFRNVHYLERHLRRGPENAIPLETLELAQDELRSGGFNEAAVLEALDDLQNRLWRLDHVDEVIVCEQPGLRGSRASATVAHGGLRSSNLNL